MNIKKLFPDKKISKKGLMEFLDKKGFYIVLILCIVIVGATAVLVTMHTITSSNTGLDNKIIPDEYSSASNADNKPVAQVPAAKATTGGGIQKVEEKSGPSAPPNTTGSAKQSSNNQSAAKQPAVKQPATKSTAAKDAKPATGNSASTAKIQKFIMPVMGSVTFEYAKDKMVYSKTLEEWRTHSGIDIGGTKGANVKAVSDGIVSEIKTDPRYGNIVVIDHLNGIKTLYANLTSCDNVNPNQRIKQGEILGTIGDSASFESDEQSHLHFEVFKNNNIVNPLDYLPKN